MGRDCKYWRLYLWPLLVTLIIAEGPTLASAHNTGQPHREYSTAELRELGLEDLITENQSVSLSQAPPLENLWDSWAFDPYIIVTLVLMAGLYATGLARLWRTTHVGAGITRGEATLYSLGWLLLILALVSPLHPWGEVLFSAHMIQHEILMLLVAPLLVLGRPLLAFFWAVPRTWRIQIAKVLARPAVSRPLHFLADPLVAWLAHGVILWSWHIPAWFEGTLTSDFIHTVQHASFLGSALLFWWAVFYGRKRVLGYGMAVFYLFTTAVHSGALGALLIFTSKLWYPAYAQTAQAWGLSPLEDQQLGGLIMWVPAGVVYIAAALVLFAKWMAESERRVKLDELQLWQNRPATVGNLEVKSSGSAAND